MTRPRPNVRRQWFICPNCAMHFQGFAEGWCANCAMLRVPDHVSTWRDVPRTGRWFIYGLLVLAVLFLLRVAADLVVMVKGWLQ